MGYYHNKGSYKKLMTKIETLKGIETEIKTLSANLRFADAEEKAVLNNRIEELRKKHKSVKEIIV